ncbi:sigma-24 [Capsulimonas corticalis]|uniref:Sigma-24 n=1 Tax=Capsulimonas corticalis TaxID=2219043 RepID=A0A402CWQ3_9BACT|nr:RNA polymerase sigma factor [Capsulimonas corticalis]BDI34216.1 sigma-24 [Capsulimonas corticalis]
MAEWEDDERLAKAYVAEGDPRALETLYRRHVDATYGFAQRFLTSREDAEEATSECWLRAFRALRDGQFRGDASFKTWLFAVMRYVCLERLRQPRLPTLSLSALTETDRGDYSLFGSSSPEPSALDDALASLTDDHRLVLTLCDLQGFTAAEAAEILGRSAAATKSLHLRARRALRDVLEKDRSQ